MPSRGGKLTTKRPVSVFTKPLEADIRGLFKALSKGVGHAVAGKWEELGTDTVEALASIGLTTEPGELAFLLVRRSITRALFALIGESANQLSQAETPREEDALDFSAFAEDVQIDTSFFARPAQMSLLSSLQPLLIAWLVEHNLTREAAATVADRLPSYFVYALNDEWRANSKNYKPLLEAVETPFAKANDREWAWSLYQSLLVRRVDESIFDETFSLRQIYVPLRATYIGHKRSKGGAEASIRVVVDLEQELLAWLTQGRNDDGVRIISGGPGSGKSSFVRLFAVRAASAGRSRVLFVPLHLIDPARDIVDEIGRFVKDEGILLHNPLDAEGGDSPVLVIFDGLDELASQGKIAAETAGAFIREIDRLVERRNANNVRLRVIISGRELVIQENQSEFRKPRQVLALLPYARDASAGRHEYLVDEEISDPQGLLAVDLRNLWWSKYGALTGRDYAGLPKELAREDLEEITAQPLLNYLVALSFTRAKIDFSQDVNINEVYADLVSAVHERGYEKRRAYGPIRHLTLADFLRVLEEIGVAAWHGDGRTTTVGEIEAHCKSSGMGPLLERFQDGAKVGVTRLLAAFFFKQYGRRPTGDPTFVFTHKSFGEYLAARRIVRTAKKIARDVVRRRHSPDDGCSETQALLEWAELAGPAAVSEYLFAFIMNEQLLLEADEVSSLQDGFAQLFTFVLTQGMPMERLALPSFKAASFQARNAEEALLAVMSSAARRTKRVSKITHPDPTTFGSWLKRIQGQRAGAKSGLALACLSFLNLREVRLDMADLYHANLRGAELTGAGLYFACLDGADLSGADLSEARLDWASCRGADLGRAILTGARASEANMSGAHLGNDRMELLERLDAEDFDDRRVAGRRRRVSARTQS